MTAAAVEARNLDKVYHLYSSPRDRLKELLSFGKKSHHKDFFALKGVSFDISKGQTTGIIGPNGSGKSTLLQIIAGVLRPTSGTILARGRISSLLELGAGFNPEFTGRENVHMNGALTGYSFREMDRRFPAIVDFAEIGEFIDQPVKTYSSGMYVRLAFACAINVEPDILIVDEALAVGDAVFQHRCMAQIRELQRRGVTILLVSHDMSAVKALCQSAILLDHGCIAGFSDPETIVNLYHARVSTQERISFEKNGHVAALPPKSNPHYREDPAFSHRSRLFRHGDGAARITNVEVLRTDFTPADVFDFDQEVVLRVHVQFLQTAGSSILGYYFRDKNGLEVVGTNTFEEKTPIPPMRAGETLVVDFIQRLPLAHGAYSVTVALAHHHEDPKYLDWVDNAMVIRVAPPSGKQIHSKVWLPVDIHIYTGTAA